MKDEQRATQPSAEEVAIDALKRRCNGYNMPFSLDCEEVIRLIKRAGVNFIFANPSVMRSVCDHKATHFNDDIGAYVCDLCNERV